MMLCCPQSWKLDMCQTNEEISEMIQKCLNKVIETLDRQYAKYFATNLTAQLEEETKSACLHNMDAEQVMGMISSLKQRSPHASILFSSSKLRAVKNKTIGFIDGLEEQEKERLMACVVALSRKRIKTSRLSQTLVSAEIASRINIKKQLRDKKVRHKIEKLLKTTSLDDIPAALQEIGITMSDEMKGPLSELLQHRVIGRFIKHCWYDNTENINVVYHGKFEKIKGQNTKTGKTMYTVAYWKDNESYDMAVDYEMDMIIWERQARDPAPVQRVPVQPMKAATELNFQLLSNLSKSSFKIAALDRVAASAAAVTNHCSLKSSRCVLPSEVTLAVWVRVAYSYTNLLERPNNWPWVRVRQQSWDPLLRTFDLHPVPGRCLYNSFPPPGHWGTHDGEGIKRNYFPPPIKEEKPRLEPLYRLDSDFLPLLSKCTDLMQHLSWSVIVDSLPASITERQRQLTTAERRLIEECILSSHLLDGVMDPLPLTENYELPNRIEKPRRVRLTTPLLVGVWGAPLPPVLPAGACDRLVLPPAPPTRGRGTRVEAPTDPLTGPLPDIGPMLPYIGSTLVDNYNLHPTTYFIYEEVGVINSTLWWGCFSCVGWGQLRVADGLREKLRAISLPAIRTAKDPAESWCLLACGESDKPPK
ncbi:hypothetical protein HAZT_HAZT006377 [Hyalella azteca]|uniref:Uncharacterized protein n=1 Tax=Hyalella azteca TaxID=294128 RepID=A0A6A0GVT8_HYAAZ|nr:hypothetical protein HAZT_HAZT006377 [Hyalella azteca]